MESAKDSRKDIWAWAIYDWANSAFATTVMAGFFPIFFKKYWSNPDSVQESTFYLGAANSIAAIIVAIAAPFLGAIADKCTAKKKFMLFFTFLGVLMTTCLWFVHQGNWLMAIVVYVIATVGFSGSNIFYDSLLVIVASPKKVNFTSSLGFALGYIGGGLLFAINVIMYLNPQLFAIPDAATAIRLSFVTVGVWWALFSLPVFLFVKEPQNANRISYLDAISAGWDQLLSTLQSIKQFKNVGLFLVAYWFYIDGVYTVMRMAVDYGVALGFPATTLIVALLIVQFVAFPSTLIYQWFSTKVGTKRAIFIGILGYIALTFLGYYMKAQWHFYALAVIIAVFQGGIQALSRSMFSLMIPEDKSAEFFGFYNMVGKFSAIIGPAAIGALTVISGSNRIGILSILPLFLVGGYLLLKVKDINGDNNHA